MLITSCITKMIDYSFWNTIFGERTCLEPFIPPSQLSLCLLFRFDSFLCKKQTWQNTFYHNPAERAGLDRKRGPGEGDRGKHVQERERSRRQPWQGW